MVRKYSLYRIAHWLRTNREQLSKVSLAEIKDRMIKEGCRRPAPARRLER